MTLTPQQCRDELARVLASPDFARAAQLRALLEWLCLRRLENPGATFTQYDIGTGCLGRRKDFDPQYDSVVRKETARLRKRLDAHYASLANPTECRIFIQSGTYLPQWIPSAAFPLNNATGRFRLLVLPFEFLSPAPEPAIADQFTIALMAELAAEPGIEVGPRYLALLHRQRPSANGFHYLVEGVLERREAALHARAWLVKAERAFIHPVTASAATPEDLATRVCDFYASLLKDQSAER